MQGDGEIVDENGDEQVDHDQPVEDEVDEEEDQDAGDDRDVRKGIIREATSYNT